MSTFAAYCDIPDFLANAGANLETASLLGGNTILSAPVMAGATSLPLASTTGFPSAGTFNAYLLDGLYSERVTASVSGSTLSIAGGIAAAHAGGVSVSSAGTGGCLGDVILRASRAIENYCRQGPDGGIDRSLYAISRTEITQGPGWRASFDPDYALVIRPWRWPVLSLAAASIQFGAERAIGLNVAAVNLETGGKVIVLPYQSATVGPFPPSWLGQRGLGFTAAWTYVAGPCTAPTLSGVPDDLRQACFLLIADILAERQNPYGLSESQQGKLHRVFRHRDDAWINALRARAFELLAPFAQSSWGNWR